MSTPSFLDHIRANAAGQSDRVSLGWYDAFAEEVGTVTFAGFHARCLSLGRSLRESGCREGDHVLLVYPPGLDFFEAFMACIYAGLIPIPTYPPNPLEKDARLSFLMGLCQRVGITHALTTTLYNRARKLGSVRHFFTRDKVWPDLTWLATDKLKGAPPLPERQPDPKEIALVQFTSGSTSAPRGVMISFENVLHQLTMNWPRGHMAPDATGVVWLPQYHDFGLINSFLNGVTCGFPIWYCSPLDFLRRPVGWLEMMHKKQATHTAGPDFGYALVARRTTPEQRAAWDFSRLRCVTWGGEPVRASTVNAFYDAFRPCGLKRDALIGGYGLAESTVAVTIGEIELHSVDRRRMEADAVLEIVPEDHPNATPLGTSGAVNPDMPIRIVDVDTLKALPDGHIGEIWTRSLSKAVGYLGDAAATEATFHATLDTEPGVTWLRTGDLGAVLGGQMFCTGRVKELVIVRGKNIHPTDVEGVAREAHPAIRPGGVAALGWEVGGAEELAVIVELKFDKPSPELIRAVADAVQQAVVREQLPLMAVVVTKKGFLPKTTSGKLRRAYCKGLLDEGAVARDKDTLLFATYAVPEEAAADGVVPGISLKAVLESRGGLSPDEAREAVHGALMEGIRAIRGGRSIEGIGADTTFFSAGIDSLQVAGLLGSVEEATGRRLDRAALMELTTLGQLTDWILSQPGGTAPATPGADAEFLPQRIKATPIQQLVWQDHGPGPGFAGVFEIRGPEVEARVRGALGRLIQRYDLLQTRFVEEFGRLYMERAEATPSVPLTRMAPEGRDRPALLEALRALCAQPMDPARPPLMRAILVTEPGGASLLALSLHHLLYDAVTALSIQRAFLRALEAEVRGGGAEASPPAPSYLAYAHRLATEPAPAASLAFWDDHLRGAPWPLPVPRDVPAEPPSVAVVGGFTLESEALQALRIAARSEGATLNHALFLGWVTALEQTLGVEEALSAYPVSDRRHDEAELVGPIVEDVLVRLGPAKGLAPRARLRKASQTLQAVSAHGTVPYPALVERVAPGVGDPEGAAPCPVLYTFLDWDQLATEPADRALRSGAPWRAGDLELRMLQAFKPRSDRPYDYFAGVNLEGGVLQAAVRVQVSRVGPEVGAALAKAWERAVKGLMEGDA